jgi:hypothetical protein
MEDRGQTIEFNGFDDSHERARFVGNTQATFRVSNKNLSEVETIRVTGYIFSVAGGHYIDSGHAFRIL